MAIGMRNPITHKFVRVTIPLLQGYGGRKDLGVRDKVSLPHAQSGSSVQGARGRKCVSERASRSCRECRIHELPLT